MRSFYDPAKEFIPQKLDKMNLVKARKSPLFIGFLKIKNQKSPFNHLGRKVKEDKVSQYLEIADKKYKAVEAIKGTRVPHNIFKT